MNFSRIFDWFSGGDTPYMRLTECMSHDAFWITLTIGLDVAVACGYMLIALHWWRNGRTLMPTPAKAALTNMRNIFLFCGICGYAFIPIKMVWPAWRLYDFFMMALVYFTWQYAWSARDLKVIYSELGRTTKLAADLERSREESRQKSIFLNSISHDLRTPLNGLGLQATLARMALDQNDPATVRTSLGEIESSVRVTADLLDRLLEYARATAADERNNITRFNLRPMVEEIFRIHHAAAGAKNLQLNLEVPAGLVINSDRVKLERILNNLVHNAVKFTHQGAITIDVETTLNSVEIRVADTGMGISPDVQHNLFNEFFQAHNTARDRTKGFGLGLAIARRLALQLGGDLTFESSPNRGTRFALLLPGATSALATNANVTVALGTGATEPAA